MRVTWHQNDGTGSSVSDHGSGQGVPGIRSGNAPKRRPSQILKRVATAAAAMIASVAMLAPSAYAAPHSVDATASKTEAVAPAAAGDSDTVADTSTIASWRGHLEDSTENIGRIWTDKSVSTGNVTLKNDEGRGDINVNKNQNNSKSDFLVGLSALSSVSNLTKTSSQPLDIVLVLDTSGSMSDQFGGGWRAPTNLEALQAAVDNFIDQTVEANSGVTEADRQHRVGIVTFSDNARIAIDLTAATSGTNERSLKRTVNSLRANGNTYPNKAFTQTQTLLSRQGRANAKKVVVFFTDGAPAGNNSDWDADIAADGVNAARKLKQSGATMYSIGIFSGAQTGVTTGTSVTANCNKFMNAVSSNYPNASATWSSGGWFQEDQLDVNWGAGASRGGYYKTASDADELNKIFQDISQEINTGSGSATYIQDGYDPNKSGYITFTDKLGQYMQLDATRGMTVVFGDQQYQCKDHTTSPDKTTDTYTFASTHVGGNGVYPEGDLKDLVITVTHGDLATGDVVTVKVPATLIPYRQFSVNQNEGEAPTMDVTEAYPIRVFYGVQPKAGVLDAVSTGIKPQSMSDEDFAALQNYAVNHKGTDGKTYFLSNAWDANAADPSVGTTTSEFHPSASNSFYYFTENTPIFTDEAMQNHATRRDLADVTGRTFYYAKTYYTKDAATGAVTERTDPVAFPGRSLAILQGNVSYDDSGNAYVKAGTARLTRVQDYNEDKAANETGTATKLLNPNWTDYSGSVADNSIRAELGNNGKLNVELPGELTVTKTVRPAAGLTAPTGKDFHFTLTLANAPNTDAAYTGKVFNSDGTQSGDDLTFTSTGGKFALKDGQTLHVYGLSSGMTYEVKEDENTLADTGFSLTDKTGETGTIQSGTTSAATFTNTYAVTPVTLPGATFLKGAKVLKGRSWLDSDSFTFRLVGTQNAPMPDGATAGTQPGTRYADVTVNNHGGTAEGEAVPFNFGDIEFTAPGTYTYIIAENQPVEGAAVPGMTYSPARYRVTVTVKDNGAGKLSIPTEDGVTMVRFQDDNGTTHGQGQEVAVTDGTATFTNTYSTESVEWAPSGFKIYTDHSGSKPLTQGMFHFQVSATGDNASDAPLPTDTILTNGEGGSILFNNATFDSHDVGQTYTYKVVEVVQQGDSWVPVSEAAGAQQVAGSSSYTLNGMTYDGAEHTFSVTVGTNEDGAITVTPTYSDPEGKSGPGVYFTNSYRPTPATLSGDTAIHGTKTLNGRDMKDGESFTFTLTGGDDATTAAMADGGSITVGGKSGETHTASVSGAQNGKPTSFNFGTVTFAKPGTYTFKVNETVPAQDGNGMKYDRHTATVTVTVTDDNGTLKVTSGPTYNNGDGKPTDQAVFVNTYTSSLKYSDGTTGGVTVRKTLDGRAMKKGEFQFTITGVATDSASADEATAKLAKSDKDFATSEDRAEGEPLDMRKLTGVTFTQDDAGKTFAYEIRETQPDESEADPRLTYDKSAYRLEIAVSDDGDGTMTATSTLTQTAGPDGQTPSDPMKSTATTTEQGTKVTAGDMTAAFTNTFTPEDVTVDLPFTKTLEGRDWTSSDKFSFTMIPTGDNAAQAPKPSAPDGTCTDGATGGETGTGESPAWSCTVSVTGNGVKAGTAVKIPLGTLIFPASAIPDGQTSVSYTYQLTENVPEGAANAVKDGIRYDNALRNFTITVSRNTTTGELSASPSITSTDGANFTNEFVAVSSLPMTGGRGTAAWVVATGGGVMLLAGAAWLLARKRRA